MAAAAVWRMIRLKSSFYLRPKADRSTSDPRCCCCCWGGGEELLSPCMVRAHVWSPWNFAPFFFSMYGLKALVWFGCPCMVWMPMYGLNAHVWFECPCIYVHEMEGVPLQFEIIVWKKVTSYMYPFFHYDFIMKRAAPLYKKGVTPHSEIILWDSDGWSK